MKLWKLNKRSSTLADMSMNRILLSELIAKGALVGIIAGFFGAAYRYLIMYEMIRKMFSPDDTNPPEACAMVMPDNETDDDEYAMAA